MSYETSFRVIAAMVFLFLIALTAHHRWSARNVAAEFGKTDKAVATEGKLKWMRTSGIKIWAVTIGFIISPESVRWSTVDLPVGWRWLGAALCVLVVPLIYWVLRSLGPNLSSGIAPLPHHALVTTGAYQWVRHPWYASLLLLLAGMALMTASWILGLLTLVRAFYYFKRSRLEERELHSAFDGYSSYARRVPAFVPFVTASLRRA
jgi:protein-S-isoprenylcysteine O-methyltransferase Ste14